jgi:hypothetical protein
MRMRLSELRKLVEQMSGGGGHRPVIIWHRAPVRSADVETYKDITGDTSTNLYAVAQIPADAPAGSKSVASLVASRACGRFILPQPRQRHGSGKSLRSSRSAKAPRRRLTRDIEFEI